MNDEIRKRIAAITDYNAQIRDIYTLLDELGITYKKNKCVRCRKDLYNILREEAGLIDDAAIESDFNGENEWIYLLDRAQSWNGYIIDNNTPIEIINEFVKSFPNGYFTKNNNTANNEEDD